MNTSVHAAVTSEQGIGKDEKAPRLNLGTKDIGYSESGTSVAK